MRLIDADELKQHAFIIYQPNGLELESFDVVAVSVIDNTPTVEYTFAEAFQKTVCDNKLYCPARPQGGWGKWVISEIRCPKCLEYFDPDYYSKEELNKCPSCGAKMDGDAE